MSQRIRRFWGALLVLRCAGACGRTPEPEKDAAAETQASGDARLVLDTAEWDFGNVQQYTELQHSFSLSNAGGAPLLLQAQAGHSCTAVPSVDELPPQQGRELEIHCRPTLHGEFTDHVILRTNDPEAPERRLALIGRVEPALVLEPDFLEVRLSFGATQATEVRAAGARAGAAKLTVSKPADTEAAAGGWPAHGLSVDADENMAKGRLRILFEGRLPGMHAGNLVVTTGLDEPREIPLSYLFVVTGTLQVSPNPVYVNLRAAGEKVTSVVVRSSQPSFAVNAVNILEGPFEAGFTRVDANGYRVNLRVLEERLDEGSHGVVGRVEIRSNDRTEPRKEIPLFAFGKVLP